MKNELYKNEVFAAVALLLCLWFKLDALIEYGSMHNSWFMIGTCAALGATLLCLAFRLLFSDRKMLWAIVKGVFVSDLFDSMSWIAFLMPIVCIEKYSSYFACASWIIGDLILIGTFVYNVLRDGKKHSDAESIKTE